MPLFACFRCAQILHTIYNAMSLIYSESLYCIQNFYKSFYGVFIFCIFYSNTNVVFADTFTYMLLPTESLELPIATSQPISVRGKSKIKVASHLKNYRVKAVQTGQVILSSGQHTFFIIIYKPEVYNFAKELQTLLKNMRGLKIGFSKEAPIIKGSLLHVFDLIQLSKIAIKHSQNFIFQAQMDKIVFEGLSSHLKKFEKKNNTPSINFMQIKNFYYLNIASTSKQMNTSHKGYLASFGIPITYNESKVEIEPMIEMQIHITELRRSGFRRFGIDWPSVYQATVLPQFIGSQLEGTLNALEESGDSNTIAKPKVICRSGGEARFLAGGEIPIRTSGFRTKGVVWKTYGVYLNFKPIANKTGEIKIQLETEISSIDPGQTIDGIPAFFTNKMSSEFNLVSTKTIALSGLTTHFQGKSQQGILFLQHIPILGRLFSSKGYRNRKTELLILVTPKVIYERS